jgi:hypothetical protein
MSTTSCLWPIELIALNSDDLGNDRALLKLIFFVYLFTVAYALVAYLEN